MEAPSQNKKPAPKKSAQPAKQAQPKQQQQQPKQQAPKQEQIVSAQPPKQQQGPPGWGPKQQPQAPQQASQPQQPQQIAPKQSGPPGWGAKAAPKQQPPPTATQQQQKPQAPAKSEPEQEIPIKPFSKRPGYGTAGKKYRVVANFFKVDFSPNQIYHYDVEFSPGELKNKVFCRLLLEKIQEANDSVFKGISVAFDGVKNIMTNKPIPNSPVEFKILDPEKLAETKGKILDGIKIKEFTVKIKLANTLEPEHLKRYFRGELNQLASTDILQGFDIILRHQASMSHTICGRSFYDVKNPKNKGKDLGGGIVALLGFFQSMVPTQSGLCINIDQAATSFYAPGPIVDYVSQLFPRGLPKGPFTDKDIRVLKKALVGIMVLQTHRKPAIRKFRIGGVSSLPQSKITFDQDGKKISIKEYFAKTYNVKLKYDDLPCLLGGKDNKNFFPMECCDIIPGQNYRKKLDDMQTREILTIASGLPSERKNFIVNSIPETTPFLTSYGLKIDRKLTEIDARILEPPRLRYGERSKKPDLQPDNGQWNMIGQSYFKGASLSCWAVVSFFSNDRNRLSFDQVEGFQNGLMSVISGIGVNVDRKFEPIIEECQFSPFKQDQIAKTLRRVYDDTKKNNNGKAPQIIFCASPAKDSILYGNIKRFCETELGIPSQCFLSKHAFKPNNQYLANLSLKVNIKLGGTNVILGTTGLSPQNMQKRMIILGADVHHPPPADKSRPSIAAVVGSIDPTMTRYTTVVRPQGHRVEIINNLRGIMQDILRQYYAASKMKPDSIIFFRDGVSEGQFELVFSREILEICKACVGLDPNYRPKITFIIVQKRNHTRLFAQNEKDTDRSGNIKAGTVVDTTICHQIQNDFYLCSHSGLKGTSRPTHYFVLQDDNNFTADEIQAFTNNLCYTYQRCTRSVSIVAPAYYAHLAAYRGQFYGGDLGSDLASTDSDHPVGGDDVTKGYAALHRDLPNSMFWM